MASLVKHASGNLVEVDILELSRFPCCLPHLHSTGAADGEGNRPEADIGNG